jgi:hypothetical protein
MLAHVKTTEDVLTDIKANFCRNFVQYILFLQEIVQLPNKDAAREYYEIVERAELQPNLVAIARLVWEKRKEIRIRQIDPDAALNDFLTDPKWRPMTYKKAKPAA